MTDRVARQELKRARRAARERELAAKPVQASQSLGRKFYGVILVDPPWRFEPYSRTTGMDRAADNHYPTMTVDAIKALPIPAAADCVLFLWATPTMLPAALETMAAWGFVYKSQLVWIKDKRGLGYWARYRHELLPIGTRGRVPCPAPGEQADSVIEAPRGRHSEVFMSTNGVGKASSTRRPTRAPVKIILRRFRCCWPGEPACLMTKSCASSSLVWNAAPAAPAASPYHIPTPLRRMTTWPRPRAARWWPQSARAGSASASAVVATAAVPSRGSRLAAGKVIATAHARGRWSALCVFVSRRPRRCGAPKRFAISREENTPMRPRLSRHLRRKKPCPLCPRKRT